MFGTLIGTAIVFGAGTAFGATCTVAVNAFWERQVGGAQKKLAKLKAFLTSKGQPV